MLHHCLSLIMAHPSSLEIFTYFHRFNIFFQVLRSDLRHTGLYWPAQTKVLVGLKPKSQKCWTGFRDIVVRSPKNARFRHFSYKKIHKTAKFQNFQNLKKTPTYIVKRHVFAKFHRNISDGCWDLSGNGRTQGRTDGRRDGRTPDENPRQ